MRRPSAVRALHTAPICVGAQTHTLRSGGQTSKRLGRTEFLSILAMTKRIYARVDSASTTLQQTSYDDSGWRKGYLGEATSKSPQAQDETGDKIKVYYLEASLE